MTPKNPPPGPDRISNIPGINDRLRGRDMGKTVPSPLSAAEKKALSAGRTLHVSKKQRTRFISRVALRLSHEAPISLKDIIGELEKKVIVHVLNGVDGNQKYAARILGMKYTTLNEKLKRYGIRIKRVSMIFLSWFLMYLSFASVVRVDDGLVKRAGESLDIMCFQDPSQEKGETCKNMTVD